MVLRFLHIPKVGGSAMSTLLSLQHPTGIPFSFTGYEKQDRLRYQSLTPQRQARIAWYDGHSPILTGIPTIDDNVRLFTMLREPVARVRSLMHHVWEGKSPRLRRWSGGDTFDTDGFLESGVLELHNLQTKMLINRASCLTPQVLHRDRDAALDLATQNLFERVEAFGLQEEFDASILGFARAFGWRTPHYVRANQRRDGPTISLTPGHVERIRSLNAVDVDLHERATVEFASRRASNGPAPECVERFQRQWGRRRPLTAAQVSALHYGRRVRSLMGLGL